MSYLSPLCASKQTSGLAESRLIRPPSTTLDQHVAVQATGRSPGVPRYFYHSGRSRKAPDPFALNQNHLSQVG
jgi:hypothetical protein